MKWPCQSIDISTPGQRSKGFDPLIVKLYQQKINMALDTYFVSNSIKLVSIGGSISGTAVTHTHTLFFMLVSRRVVGVVPADVRLLVVTTQCCLLIDARL